MAENGERILASLKAQGLINLEQLEFILDAAAERTPNRAYVFLLRWAEDSGFGRGNVTRTAPARAARALSRVREESESAFRRVRKHLLAKWKLEGPPP